MNTRRRLLMSQAVQSPPVTTDNYVAGDIAFYDSTDDKIVLVHNEDINTDTYPASRYTPIGVVVIPNSHDVYGDGSCGIMSLMAMHCDSPVTGSTIKQDMCWGIENVDLASLPNLYACVTGNTKTGIPEGQQNSAYLPSDIFSDIQCAHDTNAFYYDSQIIYGISPYLTDGSRNPGYYQTTSPSSTSNCLADFNGRDNTDKIITKRGTKDYSSWKPSFFTGTDYPAVSCCDIFHTNGTQQSDWYLPAMGELGYLISRFKVINQNIKKILDKYGYSFGATIGYIGTYWSSTEYSTASARYLTFSTGATGYGTKSYSCTVRAFIRIKPDGTITSRTTTS